MTRLEHLREYRSRLIGEVQSRVDKAIVDAHVGLPVDKELPLRIEKIHQRIRLINDAVDRLMAAHA